MSNFLTKAATVGLCLFALPSCSPEIVERWHTQYVYQDVHHRDTLVTKDSVYIREYVKAIVPTYKKNTEVNDTAIREHALDNRANENYAKQ